MIRPKGLGRGLDALLAGTDDAAPSKDALQMLAIDRLRPGRYQPRTKMDDASLFRFPPGHATLPVATGLDWSAWNVHGDAASGAATAPPVDSDTPTEPNPDQQPI